MEMSEHAVLLIARQRIQDALREGEAARAAHARRRGQFRVRLGSTLIRLGQWLIGPSNGTAAYEVDPRRFPG